MKIKRIETFTTQYVGFDRITDEEGRQGTVQVSTYNSDITSKAPKTVTSSNFTNSATTSLLGNLDLSVTVAGLDLAVLTGLITNTITPALMPILQTVTAPLDNLLAGLLQSLGIGLGQADVRVTGATCGQSVLVL